jgi:dihydrofolate synthase/folylpolyglutamate synthase
MDAEPAYDLALDYIYSFVDYSLKKASELARADFNLKRMQALLAELGDPQENYPIVHVAGTKGKGSTCALAASALQASGRRTGLYISPHLQDFAERIQVDGEPIPHATLVELVERVRPAVARVPGLTTFEITTALGFLHFALAEVEAAVIEVGLGGRLDATNVVTPRVAAITSISYDHTAVLGSTLASIAGEKAGILKEGVPAVLAPQAGEALAVLERIAAERRAPLTLVGRDLTFNSLEHSLDGQTLSIIDSRSSAQDPVTLRIPLLGAHQVVNAATAYATLEASGLEVGREAVRAGFDRVRWPCRFEVVRREPPVVLDSAHNVDSFAKLACTLDDYFPGRPLTLIFGSSEDKDIVGMLRALGPRLKTVVATRVSHPRALEPDVLVGAAARSGAGRGGRRRIWAEAAVPVEAALARALEISEKDGSIVVSAGSIFTTAGVKAVWEHLS